MAQKKAHKIEIKIEMEKTIKQLCFSWLIIKDNNNDNDVDDNDDNDWPNGLFLSRTFAKQHLQLPNKGNHWRPLSATPSSSSNFSLIY